MAVLDIVHYGNPILKKPCSPVIDFSQMDALLEDTPAKMLVRTNGALMLSQRVDEDRLLLTLADLNVNIGKLRSTLSEVAERIIDLD